MQSIAILAVTDDEWYGWYLAILNFWYQFGILAREHPPLGIVGGGTIIVLFGGPIWVFFRINRVLGLVVALIAFPMAIAIIEGSYSILP